MLKTDWNLRSRCLASRLLNAKRFAESHERLHLGLRVVARSAFWLLLLMIVVLSVIPPSTRPITGVPHAFEHIGIFVPLGISFTIGYRWRIDTFILLLAVIGGLELVQLIIPGRHARISDLVENAFGLAFGVCIVFLFNWLLDRLAHRLRSKTID